MAFIVSHPLIFERFPTIGPSSKSPKANKIFGSSIVEIGLNHNYPAHHLNKIAGASFFWYARGFCFPPNT